MFDRFVVVLLVVVSCLLDAQPQGVIGIPCGGCLQETWVGGALLGECLFNLGAQVDVGEGFFDADPPFFRNRADDYGLSHVHEVGGMEGVGGGVVAHEVVEDFVWVWGGGPFGFGCLGDLGDASSSFDAAVFADGGGDDDGVDGFEGGGWDADVVDDAFVDVACGGAVDGAHDEVAGGADAHGFEEDFGFESADFSDDEDGFAEA